jgi:hypothetical protein
MGVRPVVWSSELVYAAAIISGTVNLLHSLSGACLVCHTWRMRIPSTNPYKNHRFPVEIISHGVWLYYRFCLSYRDVEELLFIRGVIVSYEAIRKWCRKFHIPSDLVVRDLCPSRSP